MSMIEWTKSEPIWLHIGAGNIFRMYPAWLMQDLLDAKMIDRGITVYECYDEEIIPKVFHPYDNITLAIKLKADGSMEKKKIASIAEAITDKERLLEVFAAPSLQLISLTITEKGYSGPAMDIIAEGLNVRYKAGAPPLSLVSLDNCANNGDVLKNALKSKNKIESEYLNKLAFPLTMIDKITPRPSPEIAEILKADGFKNTEIYTTAKGTWIAPFVIGEECQYLVIEDNFPNGRPPLEKVGVIFTDRETVGKVEKMKVGTCLNPLHTAIAISGCLLGYTKISDCMKNQDILALVKQISKENMPVVSDPGVINPQEFLKDVLERRLPNSFIPDTPQRIAMDTSQKIPVRFGETLKLRRAANMPEDELIGIPIAFALWIHYLKSGKVEPDPRAQELQKKEVTEILHDASLFGFDLLEGEGILGKRVIEYYKHLQNGKNLGMILLDV